MTAPAAKPSGTIEATVLEAVRRGARTPRDIEADLNFALTRHQVSGHLANLKRKGLIAVSGIEYQDCDGKLRKTSRYVAVSRPAIA